MSETVPAHKSFSIDRKNLAKVDGSVEIAARAREIRISKHLKYEQKKREAGDRSFTISTRRRRRRQNTYGQGRRQRSGEGSRRGIKKH